MPIHTPDLRIVYGDGPGEPLYTDLLVPLSGPDNLRRIVGKEAGAQLEGLSLLHLKSQREGSDHPGWVEWCEAFGHRQSGLDRGVRYQHARLALEAVRQEVGFLICGLSLTWQDVKDGKVAIVFPVSLHLLSPHPYRLIVRSDVERKPPINRFVSWLRREASDTRDRLEGLVRP